MSDRIELGTDVFYDGDIVRHRASRQLAVISRDDAGRPIAMTGFGEWVTVAHGEVEMYQHGPNRVAMDAASRAQAQASL